MINKFGNMSSESIQYLFSSEDNDNFKKSLSNYDKASDKRSFKIKNRKIRSNVYDQFKVVYIVWNKYLSSTVSLSHFYT